MAGLTLFPRPEQSVGEKKRDEKDAPGHRREMQPACPPKRQNGGGMAKGKRHRSSLFRAEETRLLHTDSIIFNHTMHFSSPA